MMDEPGPPVFPHHRWREVLEDEEPREERTRMASRPTDRPGVSRGYEEIPDTRGEEDEQGPPIPTPAELYGDAFRVVRDTLKSMRSAVGPDSQFDERQQYEEREDPSYPYSAKPDRRADAAPRSYRPARGGGGERPRPHSGGYRAAEADATDDSYSYSRPTSGASSRPGTRTSTAAEEPMRGDNAGSRLKGSSSARSAPERERRSAKEQSRPVAVVDPQQNFEASKWTDLARRGNVEMNMKQLHENEREISSANRPRSGKSDDNQGGRLGKAKKEKELEEELKERDRRFREAELRTVTELQVQLKTLESKHRDEMVEMRLKHQEELAKSRAELLAETRKETREKSAKLESELQSEKARAAEASLVHKGTTNELLKEMEGLKREVEEKEQTLREQSQRNELIAQECQRKHKLSEDALTDLQAVRAEHARLLDEHHRLKNAAGCTEMQLRTEADKVTTELTLTNNEVQHLRDQTSTLMEERMAAVSRYQQLKERTDREYKQLLHDVEEGIAKWAKKHDAAHREVEASKRKIVELEGVLSDRDIELAEAKAVGQQHSAELENALKDTEQHVELLKEKCRNAEVRFEDRDSALKNAETELREVRPKVEQLLEEKNRVALQVSELRDELDQEKNKNRELVKQKLAREHEMKETLDVLKQEISSKDRKLAQLAGCKDRMQELSAARAEVAQWKEKFEAIQGDLNEIREARKAKQRTKPAVPRRRPSPPKPSTTTGTHTSTGNLPSSIRASSAPRRPPNDEALNDPDLRELELKKRRMQDELHEGVGVDPMVERIRARLRHMDDSLSD